MAKRIEKGDYVLATKYGDGNPGDHFCVGFFSHMLAEDRFIVVDDKGVPFRANGFRRVEKISAECGAFIVNNLRTIEYSGRSVWGFKRNWKKLDAAIRAERRGKRG